MSKDSLALVFLLCISSTQKSKDQRLLTVILKIIFRDGKSNVEKLSGKDVFEKARANSDPYAVKALNLFFKIYAEFVSNWSLSLMPHGGIYLVGRLYNIATSNVLKVV